MVGLGCSSPDYLSGGREIRGNVLPFTPWQSRPYLSLGHGILYRSCGKYKSSMIANQQRGTFMLSDC